MHKPSISMIAAVAQNNVIGRNNALPWHMPADLKFFVKHTRNKTVVMGRLTFDSLGKKPLPERTNIVLSRHALHPTPPQVLLCHSVEQVFIKAPKNQEIVIIGGEQVYQLFMPYAGRLYLTRIDAEFEGDAHFPPIAASEWRLIEQEFHEPDLKNSYRYCFSIYERIAV